MVDATACVWSEDNLWDLVLSSHLWVSETELRLLDSVASTFTHCTIFPAQ